MLSRIFSILVFDWLAQCENIVFSSNAHSRCHRCVNAQGFTNDSVQIGQSVEFIHGGVVSSDRKKLRSKFILDFRVLREGPMSLRYWSSHDRQPRTWKSCSSMWEIWKMENETLSGPAHHRPSSADWMEGPLTFSLWEVRKEDRVSWKHFFQTCRQCFHQRPLRPCFLATAGFQCAPWSSRLL